MITYRESGLKVTLPTGDSFRFSDCPAYRSLSGASLKEMDFGWWDASRNTLWLMELKDYSRLTPAERLPADLFDGFINKATDSLLMLASVWFRSRKGAEICSDLPISCQSFPSHPKKIKLIFLLKVNSHQIPELGPLGERVKNRIKGRAALFDIPVANVTLLDHNTAMSVGLPVKSLSS